MTKLLLVLALAQSAPPTVDEKAVLEENTRAFRAAAAALARKKGLEVVDAKVPALGDEPGCRSVKVGAAHPPAPGDVRPWGPLVLRHPKTKKLHLAWPQGTPGKRLEVAETKCPPPAPGPAPMMEVRAALPVALGEPLEFGEDLAVSFVQTEVVRTWPARCAR